MYKIFLLIYYTLYVRLTTGQQWTVPYIPAPDDYTIPGHHYPTHSLPNELTVQKSAATNIPIIVLLKPRQAKGLDSGDTGATITTETITNGHIPVQSPDDQPMLMSDWLGVSPLESASEERHINIQLMPDMVDRGLEPNAEASGETADVVPVKGRGSDKVQWPLRKGSTPLSAEQMAHIRRLLPKFGALTDGNGAPDLGQLAKSNAMNSVAFEEALKKFTGNLTDLGHRAQSQLPTTSTEATGADEDSSDSDDTESTDNPHRESTNSDKSNSNTDQNGSSNDGDSSKAPEQRDNSYGERLEKSPPLVSDRNRVKLPVPSSYDTHKGFQPITKIPAHKGWLPIKSKIPTKSLKGKPNKHRTPYVSEHPGAAANYLYEPTGDPTSLFGMPHAYPSMDSMGGFGGHFRPHRPFPKNYISMFAPRPGIRHMPFHSTGYSAFLNDPDISSTILQAAMDADTHKPTRTEPQKAGDGEGKGADVGKGDEKKEGEEKSGIGGGTEEKIPVHGLAEGGGDDMMGHHITCCDILNGGQQFAGYGHQFGHNFGQNFAHNQVIHEEVIHIPQEVEGMGGMGAIGGGGGMEGEGNKVEKPPQMDGHACHIPSHYPPHHWPQPLFKPRPLYKPRLFYKPLFFG